VDEALKQMAFTPKQKPGKRIHTMLATARATALANNMDPSKTVVEQAWVGKGIYLHGIRYHGKGMFGQMTRPRAQMRIVLTQQSDKPDQGRATRRTIRGWKERKNVWTSLVSKPIYNPKPYYNW
jgi:hypothetical protein